MSYDFSFLGREWNDLKEKIKESEILLGHDNSMAVNTSLLGCEKVVSKVLQIEKIQNQKSFEDNIQELRSMNIIDESLKVKFRDIHNEYDKLKKSSSNKISRQVSERCIANIYDILKWYANKYDETLDKYELKCLKNYYDLQEN